MKQAITIAIAIIIAALICSATSDIAMWDMEAVREYTKRKLNEILPSLQRAQRDKCQFG